MSKSIIHYDREARQQAFVRYWLTPGRASEYIEHATEEIKPGNRVVLCCRVSGHVQEKNKNLADQEKHLRERAKRLGAEVAEVVSYQGPGADPYPYWLVRARLLAERHGAKLLAETTDRLVRHPLYHSANHPDLQAREADLREMQRLTKGIIIATDLNPDASPEEVRSYQRKRGQEMKGNCGGRPRKRLIERHVRPKIGDVQRTLIDAIKIAFKSLSYRRGEGVVDEPNRTRVSTRKNKGFDAIGRTA